MQEDKKVVPAEKNDQTKKSGELGPTTRSPNYPSLDLEKSLQYAKLIFDEDKVMQIPTQILLNRWKFAKYNSYTRQILASLNYFGLVNIEGQGDKRKINITNQAFRIFENAPDRGELLKQLALKPKIFQRVWNHYKDTGLPKDDVLENELVWGNTFNFNFTKKGAKSFIANFKSTLMFANIDTGAILNGKSENNEEDNMDEAEVQHNDPPQKPPTSPPIQQPPVSEEMESYSIPLIGKKNAILNIPRPLSLANHELLKNWLDTMKNALVEQEDIDNQENENL